MDFFLLECRDMSEDQLGCNYWAARKTPSGSGVKARTAKMSRAAILLSVQQETHEIRQFKDCSVNNDA
jgi:hypothetical protein